MHGTFKPGQPHRPLPAGGGESRILVGVLAREIAVGCVLYLLLGRNSDIDTIVCPMVFAVWLALTDKHGLLRHGRRLDIATECLAILRGGLAVRSHLALSPALLAWHRSGAVRP